MIARSISVLLLVGCTPIDPPEKPATKQEAVAPEPSPHRVSDEALAWQWTFDEAAPADRPWPADAVRIQLADGHVKVTNDDDAGVHVALETAATHWRVKVGQHSNAAAAVVADDAVFAAHYHRIATGAGVAKLRRVDGSIEWDVALEGAGPISHSKYRNGVQAQLLGERLHVYGWESGGAYVEVIDPETGAQLAHTSVPDWAVNLPWEWDGVPENWERKPVLHDHAIYFAHASGISSGAWLYAIRPEDGAILWEKRLLGLGSIAHSEYWNSLQIRIDHDRVVVFGNEAAGRYLEVVDRSGATIVNKAWKPT